MSIKKYTLSREVIAGLTTFFTLSYIIIVNPQVMASSGTGMTIAGNTNSHCFNFFSYDFNCWSLHKAPFML